MHSNISGDPGSGGNRSKARRYDPDLNPTDYNFAFGAWEK